jgi:hypothetical protein
MVTYISLGDPEVKVSFCTSFSLYPHVFEMVEKLFVTVPLPTVQLIWSLGENPGKTTEGTVRALFRLYMLFNLRCMYPKAAESEVLPLIFTSPPTARLERYPVPPVMLPVPSTEKGYVVPLKTLKPPPLMERNPDDLATIPRAVTASEFTEPALSVVMVPPKAEIESNEPVLLTARLLVVSELNDPVPGQLNELAWL